MKQHHILNTIHSLENLLLPQTLVKLPGALARFRQARECEYDQSTLDKASCQALKNIIFHANESVPFYRNLWKNNGIDIGKIETPDDLHYFPIISRTDLQLQPRSSLISDKGGKASLHATSGTTTTPRQFLKDDSAHLYNSITVQRYFTAHNIPAGSTVLFLHSGSHIPIRYESKPFEKLSRRIYVSVSELIDSPELASGLKADVVVGSPQQLEAAAAFVYKTANICPPRLFVNVAERLDFATRQRIANATGSCIADVYCSSELSTLIGFECSEHQGFHINSDFLIVEVVNPVGERVGPGEQGEIVITDLYNYVSPIIRYRLGDIATTTAFSNCACRRSIPLAISHIDGRSTDQLINLEGKAFNAIPVIKELQMIVNYPFTLIQETQNSFVLQCYTLNSHWSAVSVNQVRNIISQYLGFEMAIQVKYEQFQTSFEKNSTKLRPFISCMPRNENTFLN